jgi:hypothetical protein
MTPAVFLMAALASASWPDWPPLSTINVFFCAAAFGYLCFAVLGVPIINYLDRRNRLSLPWLVLGGALSGGLGALAILALVAAIFGTSGIRPHDAATMIGYGVAAGTLVSASYWAIQKLA